MKKERKKDQKTIRQSLGQQRPLGTDNSLGIGYRFLGKSLPLITGPQ